MSVLFSNTRTRLLYNDREIFNTARSECVYLKTKHELTVSNPFDIQFEFAAADRLTMVSRPNTAQFLGVTVITHSVILIVTRTHVINFNQ